MNKLAGVRNHVRFTENISNDSNSLYCISQDPHSNNPSFQDFENHQNDSIKLIVFFAKNTQKNFQKTIFAPTKI